MNKQEIYAYLDKMGIVYEKVEHKAVFTMEELRDVPLPHPEAEAKNLFVRDDKKQSYYLITVQGEKRVDLKTIRRELGTRPLSFATEEELQRIICLSKGSVTPFGLLNDVENRCGFILDGAFAQDGAMIGVHPNDNTASVYLRCTDLLDVLRANRKDIRICQKLSK